MVAVEPRTDEQLAGAKPHFILRKQRPLHVAGVAVDRKYVAAPQPRLVADLVAVANMLDLDAAQ